MKALGAIRKIDGLGRITLPKSVRDKFDLPDRTSIEIYTNDEGIVLRKYIGGCIFCDEATNRKNPKKNIEFSLGLLAFCQFELYRTHVRRRIQIDKIYLPFSKSANVSIGLSTR